MIWMADHDGLCRCPALRVQAEIERLTTLGVVPESDVMRSLLIARLRERYGCRGPVFGSCRWEHSLGYRSGTVAC